VVCITAKIGKVKPKCRESKIVKRIQFMRQIKIIVEKRCGQFFIAHPVGVKGAKNGVGTTYEEALAGVELPSPIYPESFAETLVAMHPPVVEACLETSGGEASD
jgi:hypothetical protein